MTAPVTETRDYNNPVDAALCVRSVCIFTLWRTDWENRRVTCCPSEGASVGMLSVDCINFNSVGVQEPKLHEKDEMGHLDERCPSKKSPPDLGSRCTHWFGTGLGTAFLHCFCVDAMLPVYRQYTGSCRGRDKQIAERRSLKSQKPPSLARSLARYS